jgi:very-short-patch-repair endonuclease
MLRPLMNNTAVQLDAAVERNRADKAELLLLMAELAHRKTTSAQQVARKARGYVAAIEQGSRDISASAPSAPPSIPRELATMSDRAEDSQTARQERAWTEEAVANLRKKLIDLSKRNPLIAFRHSSRGASHLRIVDERPDLLFDALCNGAMGFEPLPAEDSTPADEQSAQFQIAYQRARLTDPAFLAATEKLGEEEGDTRLYQIAERALRAVVRAELGLPALDYGKAIDVKALALAHGFDPSFDLRDSDEGVEDHHQDNSIRVLLIGKELDKRLKTIWDRYRGHARETGLHTLFLAIGFVQWFDDDLSDIALHAPLLLLPVELERKIRKGRYEFTLRSRDEGLQVNVALVEKMARHFGLDMPRLREGETPESFFIRVEAVLAQGQRLSLRRFATLAVLPFPRMVLWQDLDPVNWADGAAFADHPLLPQLVSARGMDSGPALSQTHDIDLAPYAAKAPPLVQPADASQHSALIDIVEGKSVAIEGPPGTGKSQTITNMIAAALHDGKSVLFVAEKQAALNVVAGRLRHSGLGDLLLELHSDAANRAELYASVKARLSAKAPSDSAALEAARADLVRKRDMLRRYLSLIATPLGALNRSAYWLAWREIQLRSTFSAATVDAITALWQPTEVERLDRAGMADIRARLGDFEKALGAIDGAGDAGRTGWVHAVTLDPFDQTPQRNVASKVAEAARHLATAGERIASILPFPMPAIGGAPESVVDQLAMLENFDDVTEAAARCALNEGDRCRALLTGQMRWRQLHARLVEDVADPDAVTAQNLAALAAAVDGRQDMPATIEEIRQQREAVQAAVEADEKLTDELSEFLQDLAIRPKATVEMLAALAKHLVDLANADAQSAALYQSAIIEQLGMLTIDREEQAAAALTNRLESLAHQCTANAFECDPAELEMLASRLADTGIAGRWLGGEYRRAKHRSRKLVQGIFDREQHADILARLAQQLQRTAKFAQISAARAYFPDSLWQGIGSDWQALRSAQTALTGARSALSDLGLEDSLDRWLSLSPARRQRIVVIAARLAGLCAMAERSGLAMTYIGALSATLRQRQAEMERLHIALHAVGARPGAMMFRNGESLHDRLYALATLADEFTRLREHAGFLWVGRIADSLDMLVRGLATVDHLRGLTGPVPIVPALDASETPTALLERLIAQRRSYQDATQNWREAEAQFQAATGIWPAVMTAPDENWQGVGTIFGQLAKDEAGIRLAADLLRYRAALQDAGVDAFATAALSGTIAAQSLDDLYELVVSQRLLALYLGGEGSELGRMGSLTLEAARSAFVRTDTALQALEAQAIVAKRLHDKAPWGISAGPMGQWTEGALLDHEIHLSKPRTPIRDVVARAGKALQTIKPVWMMSPTSAAQYIRPGGLTFDIIIVDEASQMRPEFAISTILRGTQFVVVGDTNQLPPTDFFAAATDDGDGADDAAPAIKMEDESILEVANKRLQHRRRLKWHYRSQHQGLIQFSNRQFYDRQLVIFPSPTVDDDLLGVKHHYVGGTYQASINQKEAEAIVVEAFGLMRAYPQHSIGIATMNAKQTELIQNEFDRLILEAPEVRRYVDEYAGGIEEFFIKNLENVQGDERDIILISTVFGPDENGTVRQNFGPMNREVGWRRLNVLVTRAKLSTRIFTSLRPTDIKITPTSSKGLIALQAYLTYAARGAHYDDASGGEPDSDFEIFVGDALRGAGYDVVNQVGVDGFRIDLGVGHPDYPLGFIAGIECDGASFHSGLTVRDRDRIRQSILESMGWRIYRIWSTDWFADPARQTAKLLAQMDAWRAESIASYIPVPASAPATKADDLVHSDDDPTAELLVTENIDAGFAASPPEMPQMPSGRAMRPLDDIDWYEVHRGQSYEIWPDGIFAGQVTVLSRGTAAPQVYGGTVKVARSEYEGWVAATDATFKLHDIHATVRKVALLARAARTAAS